MLGPKPKLHVDLKWVSIVGSYLKNFKTIKRNKVYNCSCPYCDDDTKTKFYFYVKKDNLNVICHKCGYSRSFYNFFKDFLPSRFEDYKKETLFDFFQSRDKKKKSSKTKNKHTTQRDNDRRYIKTLDYTKNPLDLKYDDPALEYLRSRKLNDSEISRLLYTDDFKKVAEQLNPVASKDLKKKDKRIVIPFYSKDGYIEMIQGRSLNPNDKIRYISIKVDDNVDKIFGKERINRDKTIYCVEGPFDSMFVDNCIATCDANLSRSDADVLIFDNEPRHPHIVKYIEKAIESGRSVVIWPPSSNNSKLDINDMIKNGLTRNQLMSVIKQRTYSGLKAKMEFVKWKKI